MDKMEEEGCKFTPHFRDEPGRRLSVLVVPSRAGRRGQLLCFRGLSPLWDRGWGVVGCFWRRIY